MLTSRAEALSRIPLQRMAWPGLLAVVVLFAGFLAWATWDVLEGRLQASGERFDATLRRFDRYWVLYDASVESAVALKLDLAALPDSPAEPADLTALAIEARRFALQSSALESEIAQPGVLLLSPGAAYGEAVRRLDRAVALPINGDRSAVALADAREATGHVLELLARLGVEARQRQPLAGVFRDEIRTVRRQLLFAFGGVVSVLLLVVGLLLQWVRLARREGVTRRQAEHIAAVAEAERAHAEYMARDKARFLGMLSHELLTPLQSLWSTIDLIESRGRVDITDPSFQRLKESTRSLRGRISDLVDFAKMSSGRLETRLRGFQLDKLVDTALRDLEEALAAKNLDVHWDASPEISRRIWSDPARLRQVLDNLLSNAIKYTERGGLSIHAQLLDDGSILRLEVSDTGIGISEAALGRLFEPFYRAPETAAMAEGSGLGLAVVKSLVDLLGGSIRVTSRLDHGTTVTVEVPVSNNPDVEADREPPAAGRSGRPVLVVDDSRDARRAIAEQVRALGHEVYEASSGAMGLAEGAERDYLAIVLDLQMPDLDGIELATLWRRPGHRHQATFLVLVSAYNDADRERVEALFDACIDKPVARQQLAAALQRAKERVPG
jgi:signal transduction histidine kinase/CheY-like chemotaxis protein